MWLENLQGQKRPLRALCFTSVLWLAAAILINPLENPNDWRVTSSFTNTDLILPFDPILAMWGRQRCEWPGIARWVTLREVVDSGEDLTHSTRPYNSTLLQKFFLWTGAYTSKHFCPYNLISFKVYYLHLPKPPAEVPLRLPLMLAPSVMLTA